jgi:FkbM family methyltransferase
MEVLGLNRPFLLQMLPDRLRNAVWSRLYRPRAQRYQPLYGAATLRFAPHVSMALVLGDVISDSIAFTGIWEPRLSRHLVRLARQGGTMIEVGANLGYFTLLWVAGAPGNRCFAFEASPRNTELLQANVTSNGFASRVVLLPIAAGKEAGSLSFAMGPPDQTGWGGFADTANDTTIAVRVVRVDEVVDPSEEVALLKVDIEGADTWALKGCERLLQAQRIKQIWFEQNKPRMRGLGIGEAEAEEFLRSVGYKPRPQSDPRKNLVEWSASPA